MALRLYHRPDWVALERRREKNYVPGGDAEWRSYAQNPPITGQPFIAIGKVERET
jgi:hypothetical protein